MTHPAYALARLNPKNVRFDVGSGGLPELTPADVAGALGFVDEGLGRELVCRVWWPDGARLTAKDLDRLLMEAQLSEWYDRAAAILTCQLAEAAAATPRDRIRATERLDEAKERMWPRLGPDSCYGPIRVAVLAEISAAGKCKVCSGRAAVLIGNRVVPCEACSGSGQMKVSDRHRAEMIGKEAAAYRRHFLPVYEWTFNLCREAMAPAVRQFCGALGD